MTKKNFIKGEFIFENELKTLSTPTVDTDVATKKYVDDNSGGGVETGTYTITRDINDLIYTIETPSKTWTVTRTAGIITSITDGTYTWTLNRTDNLLVTMEVS